MFFVEMTLMARASSHKSGPFSTRGAAEGFAQAAIRTGKFTEARISEGEEVTIDPVKLAEEQAEAKRRMTLKSPAQE